jgi:hypothetical protein
MGRTRTSGNLVSENILSVDITNDRVGVGSTQPTTTLDINGALTATSGSITSLSGTSLNYTGVSTFGSSNGIGTVTVGVGTTALLVEGNARVTGVFSIGTSSIVFDGNTGILSATAGLGFGGDPVGTRILTMYSEPGDVGYGGSDVGSGVFRVSGPAQNLSWPGLAVGLIDGPAGGSGTYGLSGGTGSIVDIHNITGGTVTATNSSLGISTASTLSVSGVSTFVSTVNTQSELNIGISTTIVGSSSLSLSSGANTVWTSTASLNGFFMIRVYIDDANMPATGSGTFNNFMKEVAGFGYGYFADKVSEFTGGTSRTELPMWWSGKWGSNPSTAPQALHPSTAPYYLQITHPNGSRPTLVVVNQFPDTMVFDQTSGREFKIALTKISNPYTG